MLQERAVFCKKRVAVNTTDALYRAGQEDPVRPEDNNWQKGASTINGREAENNLERGREISSDRNNNADTESDPDIFTKEASDRAPEKATFDNRNNTTNVFKTYSNHKDRYAGSTNDNFDRKFVVLQIRCDHFKLKCEDWPEAFLIMLTEFAKVFYYDGLHRKTFLLQEMTLLVKHHFETPGQTRAMVGE